jgi:hypothetical protein
VGLIEQACQQAGCGVGVGGNAGHEMVAPGGGLQEYREELVGGAVPGALGSATWHPSMYQASTPWWMQIHHGGAVPGALGARTWTPSHYQARQPWWQQSRNPSGGSAGQWVLVEERFVPADIQLALSKATPRIWTDGTGTHHEERATTSPADSRRWRLDKEYDTRTNVVRTTYGYWEG